MSVRTHTPKDHPWLKGMFAERPNGTVVYYPTLPDLTISTPWQTATAEDIRRQMAALLADPSLMWSGALA